MDDHRSRASMETVTPLIDATPPAVSVIVGAPIVALAPALMLVTDELTTWRGAFVTSIGELRVFGPLAVVVIAPVTLTINPPPMVSLLRPPP
ncbi:MAG: hypothetical protein U0414_12575 [Polyangiaceae bacterium]